MCDCFDHEGPTWSNSYKSQSPCFRAETKILVCSALQFFSYKKKKVEKMLKSLLGLLCTSTSHVLYLNRIFEVKIDTHIRGGGRGGAGGAIAPPIFQ